MKLTKQQAYDLVEHKWKLLASGVPLHKIGEVQLNGINFNQLKTLLWRTTKSYRIYKQICNLNPGTKIGVTGSRMLKLRGINLGRKVSDLDLLVHDPAAALKLPKNVKIVGESYDGSSISFQIKNMKVDILSTHEEFEVINGIMFGTVEQLIKAKKRYEYQSNTSASKHKKDLDKLESLGYKVTTDQDIWEMIF